MCAFRDIINWCSFFFKLRVRKKINQVDYLYLLQCSVSDCGSNFNQIESENFVGERNVCSSAAAAAAAPGVVTEIKKYSDDHHDVLVFSNCCSVQCFILRIRLILV